MGYYDHATSVTREKSFGLMGGAELRLIADFYPSKRM